MTNRSSTRSRPEPAEWTERRRATLSRFARAGSGRSLDPHDRDEIVVAHLDLAESIARRYALRPGDVEDLRQVAYLGLIKACHRFDSSKGEDFVSFAVPTISGEVKRYLRDATWMVRPPRSLQELHSRINAASPILTQRFNRPPTRAELAAQLGVTAREIAEAESARHGQHPVSLDAPVAGADEDRVSLADTLGYESEALERVELAAQLAPAVATLSARERRIVYLRFVLEQTQQEIATQLGVTQMQISRLLGKILGSLRAALEGDGGTRATVTESAGSGSGSPIGLPRSA